MKRMSLAVLAQCMLIAGAAQAADQMILGDSFQVKNPGVATKRKLQLSAKEKASPNTIVGDPVMNGATLTVRANGTTPSVQTFALPQGTNAKGKSFWTGDAVKGFTYTDAKHAQGPVTKVRLKRSKKGLFSLRAQANGKVQALDVTPPNAGTDACVLFTIMDGDSYSVKFGAGDGKIVNKTTKQYSHKKPTAEGTCIPAPTCNDMIQNQSETDVDCGGPNCSKCTVGKGCLVADDCTSGDCANGVCQAPSCGPPDTCTTFTCPNGCACAPTTEGTTICIVPTCVSPCATSADCAPDAACFTLGCCGPATFCVPIAFAGTICQ